MDALMLQTLAHRCAQLRTCVLRRQTGASLIVALMMLIAVMVLGAAAAQMALQGEKAARNERERQIAFQAAEAALLDAETDIEDAGDAASSRSTLFAHDSTEGFVADCGSGKANPHLGLCLRAEGDKPVWLAVDFLDQSDQARTVPYGHFTGQAFQTGQGVMPARLPRYVIELMPFNMPGGDATAEGISYFYRITAVGFGTRESTQVVLQTFYRKQGT
ncbi:MAG TPA: PilX N-terminal domain-containing pilus assembly protein [Noviherbaspirillum sp.]